MEKSKVKRLFADGNYLVNWESDESFETQLAEDAAVTNVSWFAAKKYCECQGKRLPTVDEWEYAAMADKNSPDARKRNPTISSFWIGTKLQKHLTIP